MTTTHFAWKADVDWVASAMAVIDYYASRPDLKYGPTKENKALPLLDHLCELGCATRAHLKAVHKLPSDDAMLTILSNVTMALQSGSVLSPEEGGWYTTVDDPYCYIVCPGFCTAWKQVRP